MSVLDAAPDEVVGSFDDYDDLIEQLRRRAVAIELPYLVIDELAGLAEGTTGKYLGDLQARHLTAASLVRIARVLGVRGVLVVDEGLVRKMRPRWAARDGKRVRASYAKRFGERTMQRMVCVAAAEMGRRGGLKKREWPAEVKNHYAAALATARWEAKRRRKRKRKQGSNQGGEHGRKAG